MEKKEGKGGNRNLNQTRAMGRAAKREVSGVEEERRREVRRGEER